MSGSIFTAMVGDHDEPWCPQKKDLVPENLFQKGIPDVEEATIIIIESLKCLGLECDDSAREKIRDDCLALGQLGFKGRLFPKITTLVPKIDPSIVFDAVGGKKNKTTRTLSSKNTPQIMLAIFRLKDKNNSDPVLHYLNMSFARHDQGAGSNYYQPQAFDITKKFFEKSFDFLLDNATPDDLLMWILMDKIRQIPVDSKKFILSRGFMRLPIEYYSNYNNTGFDFYDAAGVSEGGVYKQTSDGSNFPFFGMGITAYRDKIIEGSDEGLDNSTNGSVENNNHIVIDYDDVDDDIDDDDIPF